MPEGADPCKPVSLLPWRRMLPADCPFSYMSFRLRISVLEHSTDKRSQYCVAESCDVAIELWVECQEPWFARP